MSSRIPNYVRSHRRRWHLSQRELAFLLGLSSQAVISQHESFSRLPQTKALIKYEVLFGEAISELFPKLRRQAELEIAGQARIILRRLEGRSDKIATRKRELLTNLIQRLDASSP
ncbi:MAG TPA: helix-turn-helix transcriptional regulator [Rhizomicrobium sp.]|jgi:DNA-binding XRE family transcriptional regulator|nr:helix-turn-helix transcriptional regulator [Rhizomicrobium sp.]